MTSYYIVNQKALRENRSTEDNYLEKYTIGSAYDTFEEAEKERIKLGSETDYGIWTITTPNRICILNEEDKK
jgi:predicted amidohydrolase YtcJ